LNGGLAIPATAGGADDPRRVPGPVGGDEGLVAVRAASVPDEDPVPGDQTLAALVPVAGPLRGLDRSPPPAVPGHLPPGETGRGGHGRAGLGTAGSLDPGPPLAGARRGRLEPVGVGGELADERPPVPVAVKGARDLVRPVAGIPGEDERAVRETDPQPAPEATPEWGRSPVGPVAFPVVVLGAVEVDEDRPSPRARGEGEPDEDREDDPLVAVPPGGVGGRGPDGVPMAGVAVDARPGVPRGAVGEEAVEEETNPAPPRMKAGPGRAGEDSRAVRPVAGGEVPERATVRRPVVNRAPTSRAVNR